MSVAATRPAARARGTRSVRNTGRTPAVSRARASSIEMVDANGLTASASRVVALPSFSRLLHEVSELWHDEFLHGQPHGSL